ncbi:MAG: phosphopyruvate hydratase, partial [Methanobacteriota archaeon]
MTDVPEIQGLFVRKILDSRGNPTVEVEVYTADSHGVAAAPSGASTGRHEVAAWPQGGVDRSVELGRKSLAERLRGLDVADQRGIDSALVEIDGTPNFSAIGGNLATAASLACAKAAAGSLGVPLYAYLGGALAARLPYPFGNVLGGGAHAIGGTSIQEFMAVATGPSFSENAVANAQVHRRVAELLKAKLPGTA